MKNLLVLQGLTQKPEVPVFTQCPGFITSIQWSSSEFYELLTQNQPVNPSQVNKHSWSSFAQKVEDFIHNRKEQLMPINTV